MSVSSLFRLPRRTPKPGRHTIESVRSQTADATGAPAEGQTGTCRKCRLPVTFLGGDWTCAEGEMYGLTNCGADLSAPYTPHEPGGTPAGDADYDHNGWDEGTPPPPFTRASLEALPGRDPGAFLPSLPAPLAVPVLNESELAQLARVADRMRAWEPGGDPGRVEDDPERMEDELQRLDEADLPPSAYLRAVVTTDAGVTELGEPLGNTPRYAGVTRTISGRLIAGIYLGTNEDGYCMVDSTDPAWCDDLIAAATRMRDALVYGAGLRPVPDDDTMMLRPVPAAAEGGAA